MNETRKIMTLQQVKAKYRLWPLDYITVCASCLQSSCWQGIFYCDNYKTANVVSRTVRDLLKLGLESPHYWPATRVLRKRLDDGPEVERLKRL